MRLASWALQQYEGHLPSSNIMIQCTPLAHDTKSTLQIFMGNKLFVIMQALNHWFKCWTSGCLHTCTRPPRGVISSQSLKTLARTPVFFLYFYFPLTTLTWKLFTSEHIKHTFALTWSDSVQAPVPRYPWWSIQLVRAYNCCKSFSFYGTLVFFSFTIWAENGTMNVLIIKPVII